MPRPPESFKCLNSIEAADSLRALERRWEYPLARRTRTGRSGRSEGRVCRRGSFLIEHRGKNWAVLDAAGQLVCLTVYKRGAEEVIRRIAERR